MADRRLLLLRHAKSSWRDGGLSDHARPLDERGTRAAAVIGVHMAQQGLAPDLVLCSTAERARETWSRVADHLVGDAPETRFDRALYLAEPAAILNHIRTHGGEATCLLVVGHNPGLQVLAISLAGGAIDPTDKFPTGALAVFDIVGDWSALDPGVSTLRHYTRPKSLV